MNGGHVVALHRFPVKAMAAEVLTESGLGWFGLDGDRRHAFVRTEHAGDFPWLTIRQVPALTRYVPFSFDDGRLGVRTPNGVELEVESPALAEALAEAHGGPVHLLHTFRGVFDMFPVSIVSVQTLAALGELAGRDLVPLRLRPNIVIDVPGEPFPEDALVGRTVQIGDTRVRVDAHDQRCMVVNFDPFTAERDPAVLRAVARHRDARAGVYGSVVAPGTLRVGDPVALID